MQLIDSNIEKLDNITNYVQIQFYQQIETELYNKTSDQIYFDTSITLLDSKPCTEVYADFNSSILLDEF